MTQVATTGSIPDPIAPGAARAGLLEGADGWHVLHDLAVPGSGASIDHVVVTPAGPFVVDVKRWDRAAEARYGVLWASKASRHRDLTRLRWEMTMVGRALPLGPGPLAVRGVIAIAGPVPPGSQLRARDIDVVALEGLVRLLAGKARRLTPDAVGLVADALHRGLVGRPQVALAS